jgi:hypothetical protein
LGIKNDKRTKTKTLEQIPQKITRGENLGWKFRSGIIRIMSEHKWIKSSELIKPFIFKLSTPYGEGTGFQFSYSKSKKLCVVATAYHVVKHAHEWDEPIRLTQYESNKSLLLKSENRQIFSYPNNDLALIVFDDNGDLEINPESPKFAPAGKHLVPGINIAWYGFPAVAPNELCFFSGHISCYLTKEMAYLVDGVAINGVSGGPAFVIESGTEETKICGVISAYIANRATGEILPGVSYLSAVEPLQQKIQEFKSLDEAKEQAKEEAESKEIKK